MTDLAYANRAVKHDLPRYCPVFKDKDGNEMIILTRDFACLEEADVFVIAIGSIVEQLLWGVTYAKRYVTLHLEEGMKHIPGHMGNTPVALIAGPLFDAAIAKEEHDKYIQSGEAQGEEGTAPEA